jgi:hypothetical protein
MQARISKGTYAASAWRADCATFVLAQWSASFTVRTPAGRDAELEKAAEVLQGEREQRGARPRTQAA